MYSIDLGDLAFLAYGSVLVVVGLVMVSTPFWLRSVGGYGAGFLGLAIALQGTRVLSSIEAVRLVSRIDPAVLDYVGPFCLYGITTPAYLAIERLWGSGWGLSLRRVWQGGAIFFVGAVSWDLVNGAGSSLPAYAWTVIAYRVVMAANLLTGRLETEPTDRVAVGGMCVILLCAVYDNVAPLFGVHYLEARHIGIVVFVVTLVPAVVMRGQVREQRLAALEQELQVAARLQQALLPPAADRPTSCPAVVRYIPMRQVGGDLYDFVPPGRRRFGVLLVDVTGHGVPAALFASAVKMAVVAERPNALDPAAFVTGLNRRLFPSLEGNLATAVHACVDLDAGRLRMVSAGHPQPLLYRAAAGQAVPLVNDGVAMGLFEDSTYVETACPLAPEDRLVLYTDGLTEVASPAGRFFGQDAVRDFLVSGASLPLSEWVDALLAEVDAHQRVHPGRYLDDLTVVALQVPDARRPDSGDGRRRRRHVDSAAAVH